MRVSWMVLLGLLTLLPCVQHARAAQGYANCANTVTSLPKTISVSGVWCLKQNLGMSSATQKAITIAADNVTLDCNDFTLSGTAGSAATSVGIYTKDHVNATVRNCTVQGFRQGLLFESTGAGSGHRVEGNRFSGNWTTGIRVDGDHSLIRDNEVTSSGGSTTSPGAWGIYATGLATIADNIIHGATARAGGNGSAYGIYTTGNLDGSVVNNHVSGLAKDGAGKIYGIYNASSAHVVLRDNVLFGDSSAGSVGLSCTNSSGRAMNNTLVGFATGLQNCGDGGGNDLTP